MIDPRWIGAMSPGIARGGVMARREREMSIQQRYSRMAPAEPGAPLAPGMDTSRYQQDQA
jgi:hypothetical protein